MKQLINKEMIINYLRDNKLSKLKFCKTCNISYQSLIRILEGDSKVKLITVYKICKTINVELKEIFKN